VTKNRDLTRSGLKQSFKDFYRGGLPCPIRAQKAETFSNLNFQAQPAHGFDFTVIGFAQVATLNGSRHATILT
jgi:hypothetical protein